MISRKQWKRIAKIALQEGAGPRGQTRPIDYTINDRATWKAAIGRATVGGKVGVIVSGMDCDCCKYWRESVVDAPPSVVAWLRGYEHHCSYLDGPETLSFVTPDKVQDGYSESRDLALEAFEDGHPHVVYG